MNKKWLFLRGAVPKDRNPAEIEHDTLEHDDDMWMHLFAGLVGSDDEGHVIYYNAPKHKVFNYRDNFTIWHYPKLSSIDGQWDYIFARGGFPEYEPIISRLSGYKIYYGAGKRFIPAHKNNYDCVLVDSDNQKRDVLSLYPDIRCEKIIKPAAPLFYPRNVEKKYHCCFVAGVPNPCKMVQWVYDTCPRDISILQLGYTPENHPENVTVRRVPRWEMPEQICSCRVGIVPYSSNDSGPRVIPEFMACGVYPVICNEVNSAFMGYETIGRAGFWRDVIKHIVNQNYEYVIREYREYFSLPVAISHLKGIIRGR